MLQVTQGHKASRLVCSQSQITPLRKSRLSANHTDIWWEIQGQSGKGASTSAGPYTCARVTGHCNTYGNAVTQRLIMPQQIIRASVETAQVRLSMLSFSHQPHKYDLACSLFPINPTFPPPLIRLKTRTPPF